MSTAATRLVLGAAALTGVIGFAILATGGEPDPTTTGAGRASSGSTAAESELAGGSVDIAPESAAIEADPQTEIPSAEPEPTPPSTQNFDAIRNQQDKFNRFGDTPSAALELSALTEAAPRPDNGSSPEGQFRVACEYSHFGNDDPIIFPGQPGASHLHMFFGNTDVDAFTTADSLLNTGGGTCSGFELNRSGYWTPALLDGQGNAVVPDSIILYYKTTFPDRVQPMPQGLQMLAGNVAAESFEASDQLHWSCGPNGGAYNKANTIPDCGGDYVNATIQFPNCWDGVNLGVDDFQSHLVFGADQVPCPASHPVRLPQISVLLYYPGDLSTEGWRLASDDLDSFNGLPGGTLHADWWGAWNDETMDLWISGCMRAARNCSFGQTGTDIQLAGLNDREIYEGPNLLPLPK